MSLQNGGNHLGAVGCETAGDGEVCPMEVLFDSKTKPQKAGLEKRSC